MFSVCNINVSIEKNLNFPKYILLYKISEVWENINEINQYDKNNRIEQLERKSGQLEAVAIRIVWKKMKKSIRKYEPYAKSGLHMQAVDFHFYFWQIE